MENKELHSLDKSTPGRLIILGTTIGNHSDYPTRSLQFLRSADLLVFEEDGPARAALKAAEIHRPYLKLSEHGESATLDFVREALISGKIVTYMSDQGMPNLADPGRLLLDIAETVGAELQVVPGPSSLSAAVAMCRFVTSGFYFYGFLPRKLEDRIQSLKDICNFPDPIVIFDTPYRRQNVLQSVMTALGSERRVFIALDVSGPVEKFIDGSAEDVWKKLKDTAEDLNFVLILQGGMKSTYSTLQLRREALPSTKNSKHKHEKNVNQRKKRHKI